MALFHSPISLNLSDMLNKLTRTAGISILGASLMFLLAACADGPIDQPTDTSNDQQVAEESNTLKVGAIFPLTGDGAAYGDPLQKVAQIALEEVNAAGGVNGKEIEFIWEDGKCNGADAANAARKLIEVDQVKVIFGGFCSGETLAVAPLAEAAGVIVLSPGSSSPDITTAGDYIFRNYPSDAKQGKVIGEEANAKGYAKVAMLTEQNDYTIGIQNVFSEHFTGEVISETYLPDDSDFRTALVKLQSEEPDALFINPQTPTKADLIFKQIEEMDWDVDMIGNDVVAGYQDLTTKYAELVEGMLVAEFAFDRSNPDFIALEEEFKTRTGTDLPYGTYASTTYDAVSIVRDMLTVSETDTEAMKNFLYGLSGRTGLSGSLTLDSNGDPNFEHRLETIVGGEVVPYESEGSMMEEGEAMEDESMEEAEA